ncbi:MAG: hypothetical protein F9K29_07955 [Hyphomicrobiaceae bacterium]|nr:MAG: hypothetical protein F9K29_07955 [Hyphomicrobiaceae bacterium]
MTRAELIDAILAGAAYGATQRALRSAVAACAIMNRPKRVALKPKYRPKRPFSPRSRGRRIGPAYEPRIILPPEFPTNYEYMAAGYPDQRFTAAQEAVEGRPLRRRASHLSVIAQDPSPAFEGGGPVP